ncbi:TnsD family Tn7-like transposition protein [Clostridium sp. 'White wine YQ']|uniref:TnsD family Tn7-like transposition protein n=1 Tax=Clostridium sp. 'White wine YQ' TaxID=3027474 RepID=UPI00236587B9|nr:TnsD family Tn7-like transposition protein [Clostridium sp. 'White wine YQ']MDD7795903.1 TnsD family Tn7-like transposition protein [Clostridium sp. 'White wine YQ']
MERVFCLIDFITTPYNDEIFYSWFGRYNELTGYRSNRHTNYNLLGIQHDYITLQYPLNLNFLCSNLPDALNIFPDDIIKNNTSFPFYKPFLRDSQSKYIIKAMQFGTKGIGNKYPSILFSDKVVKVCSQCVVDDEKKYGEAYIHRSHQIPCCFICQYHNIILDYVDLSDSKYTNRYFVINNIIDQAIPLNINDDIYNQLLGLQSDIICLLNANINNYNIERILNMYKQKLLITGYSSNKGIVNHKKLVQDFSTFYTDDFLTFVNSNITESSNTDWLYGISQNITFNLNPIKHLLAIRFLYGGFNNFINSNEEYLPFGQGPWPCLNIASEHYKKDMISSYKLKKSTHDSTSYGVFACKCGFTYTRKSNEQMLDNRYTFKSVINWGIEWENKATNLIITENYSIRQLCSILNCSFGKIMSHATKNQLLHHLNTKVKYRPIKDIVRENADLLERHKDVILKFIREHKDMSRREIFKVLHRECNTVLANDKEWYDNIMPPKKTFYEHKEQVDWANRDLELSNTVLIAINDIKENTDLKITRPNISKRINYHLTSILNNLTKLPITKKIIEESYETREEYLIRKIDYTVKNSIKDSNILTVHQYIKKLGFRKEMTPYLRNYLAESIRKFSDNELNKPPYLD